MKNNIGFFSHYTDAPGNGKFILLHASYPDVEKGLAMEARFWRLNCLIGAAPRAKLDLSIPKNRAEAIKATMLNMVDFRAFIELLASQDIDLIHKDGDVIWTEQTQEDLDRAMTSRIEAKTRREGKKRAASSDAPKTSPDDPVKLDDSNHGQERPGQEGKGAAAAAARDELSTGEEAGPKTPEEAKAFEAWALWRASTTPGVRFPKKYAESIIADPARFEEFRASRPPPAAPAYPAPGDCPECGGDMMRHPGQGPAERRCTRCGYEAEYRDPGGWTARKRTEKRIEEAVG